ncbi:MAG TPA: hypothetical protein VK358_09310 [Longimicrobium sp.]|nr:hypothetical protein [Longimicrobium sp.]
MDIEQLRGAGAQHVSDAAPPFVTREWFLEDCERQVRVLKRQEDEQALTEAETLELAGFQARADADATPTGAMRLWKHLGYLYRVRSDNRVVVDVAAMGLAGDQANHDMAHRTPTFVLLDNGRRVAVTGRSFGALLLMGSHGARAQMEEMRRDDMAQRHAAAVQEARQHPWWSRRGRRCRLKVLATQRAYERLTIEAAKHRLIMWAHALTKSGARHPPDEPVPDWIGEITHVDEAALFEALNEVGPRRIAALVASLPKPKRARKEGGSERPDFGPDGLLAAYGFRLKVPAAELIDVDLGRVTAELLTSMPDISEEMSGS